MVHDDGKRYSIKDILRRWNGSVQRARIQARIRRPYDDYFNLSNDPRGLDEPLYEGEEHIFVRRNCFVYFPSRFNKETNLYLGKILCFVAYYIARGTQQHEFRFSPTSLDDDLWCEVYAIKPDGSLIPAQCRFKKISLKLVNCESNIAQVAHKKVLNFDPMAFLDLKKQLWDPILKSEDAERKRSEEQRQEKLEDMTCPITKMKMDEVWNEIYLRLAITEKRELPAALEFITDNIPDLDESDNLLESKNVRKILRFLRQNRISFSSPSQAN